MKEFRSLFLTGIPVLLVLSALCGGVQAWISEVDLRAILMSSPVEEAAKSSGIPMVDTRQMKEITAQGSHLILDARTLAEYDQGHLPGAMSLPYSDFEDSFIALAPLLSPTDPLVVYCSSRTCDDALLLAQRLQEVGFENLSLYVDGWEGWGQ